MNSKRVYILGAGSSIGHSKGLFPSINSFFAAAKKVKEDSGIELSTIRDYIIKWLGKDILSTKDFVDIEAVFTHIEIELERKPFDNKLHKIRQELLKLIQRVLISLEKKIDSQRGEYHKFVQRLNPEDTVITFNWDLLLDNVLNRKRILKSRYTGQEDKEALSGHYWQFIFNLSALGEITIKHSTIDYPYSDWISEKGYYLKAHGSIDWFNCANVGCRGSRKVFPLLKPMQTHYCSECHEPLESLLIPPILNKTYRQYPLIRKIWNVAEKEVASANELIIWGYSLPPADFYSSWLLRQAREAPLRTITIINPSTVNKKGRPLTSLGNRFYNIFRNKIDTDAVFLYKSFDDYFSEQNKYALEDLLKRRKLRRRRTL